MRSQASSLKKDLEALKTKYNEVSEKLMEKNRQYQKLQVSTRKKVIISTVNFCRECTRLSEGKSLHCLLYIASIW